MPQAHAASSLFSKFLRTTSALGLLACWLWAPRAAVAQTVTARLHVEVRDARDLAIAAATVTLSANGQRATEIIVDADGRGTFAALRPGRYEVTVRAASFVTSVTRGLLINDGIQATLPVRLIPGGPTERVEVVATAATLRIGTGAVGRAFEGDAMRAQPAADRDVLTFMQQAAGMAPPAPGSRLSTQGNAAVNSSGARETANNFWLDGLDNNDLFLNRLIVNPSLDAVASVTLRQNTYDAEFGRSAGAHIDIALKSGSTVGSGSAYEFYRTGPRHLFGGTFGGPVARSDRSFFFASVEGVNAREADPRQAHVPTLAERNGDFSASGAAIVDPLTGRPFAGNVIPAGRISLASRAVASLYPLPNSTSVTANYSATPHGTRGAANGTLKVDRRLRDSDFISLRYSGSNDARTFPYVARNRNLPGFGLSSLDRGHSLGLAYTEVLSPRVLHALRAGVTQSRRDNVSGQQGVDGFAALGITGPSLPSVDLAYPTILVAGLETLGDDANLPVVRRTRTWHVVDTFTVERGRHQWKAGVELRTFRSDGDNHLFARGRMSFSGAFTGNAFADLLLGYPSFALLGTNNNRQALRTWAANGFAQDEWRASSRLTVSSGVRYEFAAPPTDADNRMRIFDQETRSLVDVGVNGVSRSGIDNDFNNVAPRIGFSWDASGRGDTVVRGGYGIFYDSGTLIESSALYFNPPYYTLQLFIPTPTSLLRIEDPFPAGRGSSPSTTVNSVDQRFRTGYAHQVSVGVEQTLAGVKGTARYVGAFGRNLVRKRNINQPVPGPGALDARRPLVGFGDVLIIESKAHSTYHGLQLSLDRPLRRSLELHAAYTFSQSHDDASAFLASDGNDNTPQNSNDIAAEWGRSDFDVRHRAVLSATWATTAARSKLWRLWTASVVINAQSGRPFTPRLSVDNSNTGNTGGATFASDRPDVLVGDAAPGQANYTYGGQTFVMPARYSFGTAGRNILTGPGYASVDALLSRGGSLGGRRRLDLRVEVFNVLNRRNASLPDSFVDHATFGQSLAAFPARQFQVALRLQF